jgi:sugar lactone lactonase YvrE
VSCDVIAKDAVMGLHHGNAVTGECPFWDAANGILWWIDIQGQRLLGHAPASGQNREISLPSMPGLLVGRRSGGLLIGLEDGLFAFDPAHGLGRRLIAVEADDTRTRINDGKPDALGRLWFGTMDKTGGGTPIGALYRLDLDGTLLKVRDKVRVPNGIDFSPDGQKLYFCDSPTGTIEVMPYDEEQGITGRSSVFMRYSGPVRPDGICVDRDGALWIALVDTARIERRLPDGRLDLVVELPVSRPTMATLGGGHGRTLFITSQRRFLSQEALTAQPLAGDLLAVCVDRRLARDPFLVNI